MSRWRGLAKLGPVPAFFAIKIIVGLALLKVSAAALPVEDFTIFSQFLLLSALLNMVAVGGAQNGLIRQSAAARGDDAAAARAQGAAFAIWSAVIGMLGPGSLLLAGATAILLVGDVAYGWVVPLVVLLSLMSGPGQIHCALLTGRGQIAASLGVQAIGLIVSGAGAIAVLQRGDAVGAVLAFAAGPIVTTMLAWGLAHRAGLSTFGRFDDLSRQMRTLLGYSGAFVATASYSALTYFALRYAYREAFGVEALGEWLVANRISDTTTQLLGLFMVQIFLPAYTPAEGANARRVLWRSWAAATIVMASFLGAFAMAPEFLVRTLLSSAYLTAIPAIMLYMAGDILRASTSLAMHAAFARARLVRYVMIEVATVTLFAALTLAFIAARIEQAPFYGYLIAYAVAALVLIIVMWISTRQRAFAEAAPPSEGRV